MNATSQEILGMLKEREAWVSGEDIGARFGMSRSAVSKHIGALRDGGYEIESSSRRGYLFRSAPKTPSEAEVAPRLTTRFVGRSLAYIPEVDSTNSMAADRARSGAPDGMTVTADCQSAGRGRLRRQWFSPPGDNLYFSVLLRPAVPPWRVGQLPLVAAVAVLKALDARWPALAASVKWPNDILVDGRKLCGILCESAAETDLVHHVIVGIGLNCNTRSFPAELRDTATSLRIETGGGVSRPALLADVLNALEPEYERWREAQDLSPFLPLLTSRLAMHDRHVVVKNIRGELRGRVTGIAADGGLVLETSEGPVTVVSGDVS